MKSKLVSITMDIRKGKVYFMKKFIIGLIVVIGVVGAVGMFGVNFVFDRMVGENLVKQLGITDTIEEDSAEDQKSNEQLDSIIGEIESSVNEEQGVEGQKAEEKITTEQIKEVQKEISTVEKAKVLKLVTSKFSMEEIKDLSSMATGGVNQEELQEVKTVLKERMGPEDIEYLRELYNKYNQ